METTPGKRIQIFRESKGYKRASAFAEVAGLKPATLSSIETDRTAPSFDTLGALMSAFPDLNPDWLLTGTGSMLRDGRSLAPLPKDPTPPTPQAEAAMQVVAETDEVKELKRRMRWLEEQVELWQQIALSGADLSKVGGGASFNMGNDTAAMWLAA